MTGADFKFKSAIKDWTGVNHKKEATLFNEERIAELARDKWLYASPEFIIKPEENVA